MRRLSKVNSVPCTVVKSLMVSGGMTEFEAIQAGVKLMKHNKVKKLIDKGVEFLPIAYDKGSIKLNSSVVGSVLSVAPIAAAGIGALSNTGLDFLLYIILDIASIGIMIFTVKEAWGKYEETKDIGAVIGVIVAGVIVALLLQFLPYIIALAGQKGEAAGKRYYNDEIEALKSGLLSMGRSYFNK